ncbi:hypothetical protein J7K24_02545 [bacterium]|nr:hypothetical protein [bacterium]
MTKNNKKNIIEQVLIGLIRNTKPEWNNNFIEECAVAFAKPSLKILVIFTIFTVVSIIYGIAIWQIFLKGVPLSISILLNIPWIVGILIGIAIFKIYLPRYKTLFKKFFGNNKT